MTQEKLCEKAIAKLSADEYNALESKVYENGNSDGKADGIAVARKFVEGMASEAFLAGNDKIAEMLRSIAKKIGELK